MYSRREEAVKVGEASGTPVVMDYWKNYITIHHVMACELSYSLIYDNIRPDKLTDALATVGLTRLPIPTGNISKAASVFYNWEANTVFSVQR